MRHMVAVGLAVTSLLTWGCSEGPAPTRPSTSLPGTPTATGFGSAANLTVTWSCITEGVGCPARTGQLTSNPAAATAPGSPGNLMSFVNGTTVSLGWLGPTSGDSATSYVIEAGSTPGASNIIVFDTGTAGSGFTATSVPAATYYVRVRARNAAGTSGPSNEVTIVVSGGGPGPCTGAPGAPTNLMSSVNGSTVFLSWNSPSGGCATTYGVEAGSSSGASNLASILTGNASTSFTASSVPPGTYFVRVRAGNGNTLGGVSNEVVVSVSSTGGTLTILPATLPTLTVGVPISIALSVVGGTGTGLVFSPNNIGSQIPGLSINTPTPGFLSGTPTTAGPYLRGFSVRDSAGNTGSIVYSGSVNP